ncbi:hypothetical protein FGIG_01322 [Fasciola gigantica]|uniref:Nicotinamide riboside kinase 1 n=1 Tax=Fasciola gigantica TaxID=46835 RepID=A0A504YMB6_FASGI|nr:hypothetical protein FGIG_01322 [Fasciola gigantica]
MSDRPRVYSHSTWLNLWPVKCRQAEVTVSLIESSHISSDINDPHHVKNPITGFNDYDCLSAVDWSRLTQNVRIWCNRPLPLHSSVLHRILLIEGTFVLENKDLLDMMDVCLFLTLNYQTMVSRRRVRVYNPPDPPDYFDSNVWPAFQRSMSAASQVSKIVKMDVSNFQLDEQVRHIWNFLETKLPSAVTSNCPKSS